MLSLVSLLSLTPLRDKLSAMGHIIVCGMGDVGYRVVELLRRMGESVVVITQEVYDDRRRMAEAFGVRMILGDARDDRRLHEAGLASAKAVIAATGQDLVNLEVALDSRRVRPEIPVVIRLFDQELARQLESSFAIHRALGMSALAAPSYTAAALGEAMLASLSVGGVPWVAGRQSVADGGPLALCPDVGGVARRLRMTVLARERPDGDCGVLPAGETPLQPGDRLTLLGLKEDWDAVFSLPESPVQAQRKPSLRERLMHALRRGAAIWLEEPLTLRILFVALCVLIPAIVLVFHLGFGLTLADALFFTIITLHGEIGLTDTGPGIKMYEILLMVLGSITLATIYSMITDYLVGSRLRKLLSGRALPRSGHVVVVGMGNIGFRVVDELAALGVPAVAVDADDNGPFLATVRAKASLVVGDARLDDTLQRAGLPHARSVVAVTDDDSVNLGIGMAAKRMNPKVRTVVRLFDAELARKVESSLGIDAALGSSRIAAPTFVAAALFRDVAKAFIVRDHLFVLTTREEHGAHVLLRDGSLAVLWRKGAPAGSVKAQTAPSQ